MGKIDLLEVGFILQFREVFSESNDLSKINGQMSIWAYPSLSKILAIPSEPIVLNIKNGLLEFDPGNNIYSINY